MKRLPEGYYAVRSPDSECAEKEFLFRGERYSAVPGKNLFGTVQEAALAAEAIPKKVIAGLPYESFLAPVILFSAGEHTVDKTVFRRPVVLLGNNAGIDPNLPAKDGEAPALNPAREKDESVLCGSYWFGTYSVAGEENGYFLADGFSAYMSRFSDGRTKGGKAYISFKNMIHKSHCGKNLYVFAAPDAEGGIDREINMENVRLSDFDDLDYGGMFMNACASKITLSGVCYEKTGQFFGFSDLAREVPGCPANKTAAEYLIKDSYFGSLSGESELCTGSLREGSGVSVKLSDCTFRDASVKDRPPLSVCMSPSSALTLENCRFIDTRGNAGAAVSLSGEGGKVTVRGCTFEGFASKQKREAASFDGAPSVIAPRGGRSKTEDPHTVIAPDEADFSPLDRLYKGRKVSWGDLHVHTDCGGTSDGKTPMKDFTAGMDARGVDFAAVVDHRQMRGFFLPEWDDKRFIIGTEPGTSILDLNSCRHGQSSVHYNMLFPHKYSLAMVLANFPEFEFRGDELTGFFKYPKFTKKRFAELTAYVRSIGGIMVHPHPKTMLSSDDPLDYSFGDGTFLETLYVTPARHASFKNYALWKELLDRGLHIYASGGSDTHGAVSNKVVAAFYTKEKNGRAFFEQMRSGDFTVGCFGIKMCIDGSPMGSELDGGTSKTLLLRVCDLFAPTAVPNTAYELRIFSDKGLAFAGAFDGTLPQSVALKTKKRRFYRAEIFDLTHGYPVAIGNPIWLDGKRI